MTALPQIMFIPQIIYWRKKGSFVSYVLLILQNGAPKVSNKFSSSWVLSGFENYYYLFNAWT